MSDFTPTKGQEQALQAIRALPKTHPTGGAVLVVSGYAGTGKTTLLKVIAQEQPGTFVITPTGKAAVRVMQAAGCDALTIHRWQYIPRADEKTGKVIFDLRQPEELRQPVNKTIFVDEASMLTKSLFENLHSFATMQGFNIVLIGDGFQLPPVDSEPEGRGFSVFSPDFKADVRINLTEVLRQALESPILRVCTMLRMPGANLLAAAYELDFVSDADRPERTLETLKKGGVVLCHTNLKRHYINRTVRTKLGCPEGDIAVGEPLLVMKNNYSHQVFNGETFPILSINHAYTPVAVLDRFKNKAMNLKFVDIRFQGSESPIDACISIEEMLGVVDIDINAINGASKKARKDKVFEDTGRMLDDKSVDGHLHASLGYALTVHKAQGSEWDHGVVIVESSVQPSSTEGRRWLYTALTRMKKTVGVYI